jgi:15-cis-phytoene synthase
MQVRDADALARACDLGLAMQLTNIARDVGEDARAGRLYLPQDWLTGAGVDPEAFLASPAASPAIRLAIAQLLAEADRLYRRSEAGVAALPLGCRPGILAARLIYAGIGQAVRRNNHDSITTRARTGRAQKLGWLGIATLKAAGTAVLPRAAVLHAPPVAEVAFLVQAAAQKSASRGRSDALLGVLAQLEARDRGLSA